MKPTFNPRHFSPEDLQVIEAVSLMLRPYQPRKAPLGSFRSRRRLVTDGDPDHG
jgi:hypothetical protein